MRKAVQFAFRSSRLVATRFSTSAITMPFEATTNKLDSLINSLENELGERSVSINPDDPWASFRLKTFSVSPLLQVKSCSGCSYKLTLPFETKCPSCGFKGEQPEAFPLLTVEQMLASLPTPVPAAPASTPKKKQEKSAPKPKKDNNNNGGSGSSGDEVLDGWNKCSVQVSKISSVENHPTAEQLYVIQLDVGADKPRQVCAGLVKYYEPEKLVDRLVCTMMNLKPKKLRGVASTAMVLAGSEGDQVRVVDPPAGSEVGDILYLDGSKPNENTPKALSSTIWTKVVSGFKVQDGKATVSGKVLVSSKGACSVPDLSNGSEIH